MLTRRAKIESDFKHRDRLRRLLLLIIPRKFGVAFLRRRLKDNNERCSLEATKFLLDTNTLYSSKFHFLLPKFLRFVFALGALDIQTDFVNQFVQALKTTRSNPQKRKAICEEMLIHTRFLQSNSASSSSWKLTSLALSGFGFIRAGQIARRYCLDSAIREANSGRASTRTLHLAISGLLENRRFEEAQHLMSRFEAAIKSDPRLQSYLNYLTILNADIFLSNITNRPQNYPAESHYLDLVANNSVALVAPGIVNSDHGGEIDKHNVVARVKYLGNDYSQDSRNVGTRCDINFLLDQFAEKIISDRTKNPLTHSYLDNIRLVVTRKTSFNAANFPETLPLTNLAPTFLTTATLGTLAIFDLLCRNPKKVKLFGFNFYTERQQYNSAILMLYNSESFIRENGLRKNEFEYGSNRRGSSIIASSRSNHDNLSDFLLVKNLYELSGLIDGTPEVLEILNLTADEYDARLEEMLGDW
jgi:hypothetical protein